MLLTLGVVYLQWRQSNKRKPETSLTVQLFLEGIFLIASEMSKRVSLDRRIAMGDWRTSKE